MCHNGAYDLLWQIPVPPKVHHFLWRLCHLALPTKQNLGRRGISVDSWCAKCRYVSSCFFPTALFPTKNSLFQASWLEFLHNQDQMDFGITSVVSYEPCGIAEMF